MEKNDSLLRPTFEAKGRTLGRTSVENVLPSVSISIDKDLEVFDKNEVFVSVKEAGTLLDVNPREVRRKCSIGKYVVKVTTGNGGEQYQIALSSLPVEAQRKWVRMQVQEHTGAAPSGLMWGAVDFHLDSATIRLYQESTNYNRRRFDKYRIILKRYHESGSPRGAELDAWVEEWNRNNPEDLHTSPQRIYAEKQAVIEHGWAVLIGQFGKRRKTSIIDDHEYWNERLDLTRPLLKGEEKISPMADVYKFFKSVYLKEGAPSIRSCYIAVKGFARELGFDDIIRCGDFPSEDTFVKKVKDEIGEAAMYRARYGEELWNKKYASFAHRDYSQIKAGEVWVSDHRQIDQMWVLPNGTYGRPWITVWRCFKTSKWLSWLLHIEAPNSEHVFETFSQALEEYGIPEEILIDNGKDYRVKDFAGGRKKQGLALDEDRVRSLTGSLGIRVHFSKPYRAQTKPIERDFLVFKEYCDKHSKGYWGGNSVERPEEVRPDLSYEDGVKMMDEFVEYVMNELKSDGKVLQGKSRNELFNEEFEGLKQISDEALRLYRFRVSGSFTVKRNGVYDSKIGDYYYAPWMESITGTKVYLRRNPKAWEEAWVFSCETDEFMGTAKLGYWSTQALAKTSLEYAEVQAVIRAQNRQKKTIKKLNEDGFEIGHEDLVRYQKQGIDKVVSTGSNTGGISGAIAKSKIKTITKMDEAARAHKRMKATGTDSIVDLIDVVKKPERKRVDWMDGY